MKIVKRRGERIKKVISKLTDSSVRLKDTDIKKKGEDNVFQMLHSKPSTRGNSG